MGYRCLYGVAPILGMLLNVVVVTPVDVVGHMREFLGCKVKLMRSRDLAWKI